MSGLLDTVARAASAIAELDSGIDRVDVDFTDGQDRVSVRVYRCRHCEQLHVLTETSRYWSREDADARTFDHDRPCM